MPNNGFRKMRRDQRVWLNYTVDQIEMLQHMAEMHLTTIEELLYDLSVEAMTHYLRPDVSTLPVTSEREPWDDAPPGTPPPRRRTGRPNPEWEWEDA